MKKLYLISILCLLTIAGLTQQTNVPYFQVTRSLDIPRFNSLAQLNNITKNPGVASISSGADSGLYYRLTLAGPWTKVCSTCGGGSDTTLAYYQIDSISPTLYVFHRNDGRIDSLRMGAPGGSDSTFTGFIDSTGQVDGGILWGQAQKIHGHRFNIWDSVNHRQQVNADGFTSIPTTTKFSVRGDVNFDGDLYFRASGSNNRNIIFGSQFNSSQNSQSKISYDANARRFSFSGVSTPMNFVALYDSGTSAPGGYAGVDHPYSFVVNSTRKGVLLPRVNSAMMVSSTQRFASTDAGLLLYNTDSLAYCFFNGTVWRKIDQAAGGVAGSGVNRIGLIDSLTKSSNGAVISGTNLINQTASATFPGLVSTAAQIFAGLKTYNDGVSIPLTGMLLSFGNAHVGNKINLYDNGAGNRRGFGSAGGTNPLVLYSNAGFDFRTGDYNGALLASINAAGAFSPASYIAPMNPSPVANGAKFYWWQAGGTSNAGVGYTGGGSAITRFFERAIGHFQFNFDGDFSATPTNRGAEIWLNSFLMPRATPAQRNTFTTDVGRQVINSTLAKTQSYNGTYWTTDATIFSQITPVTLTNTTTETSIIGAGSGTLIIPAANYQSGNTYRVKIKGTIQTSGTPTLNLRVKLNTTTVCLSNAVTLNSVATADYFELDFEILCSGAIGVTAPYIGTGKFQYFTNQTTSNFISILPTAGVTLNSGIPQTVAVTAQWGTANASNILTINHCTVSLVN